MSELVTRGLVSEVLTELVTAFPGARLDDAELAERAAVYHRALGDLDGDAIRGAAKAAIKLDRYFPRVSRLRELAADWTTRNRPTLTPSFGGSDRRCRICGAEPTLRTGMRPVKDARGRPVLDAEQQPTYESYEVEDLIHDRRMHGVNDRPETYGVAPGPE